MTPGHETLVITAFSMIAMLSVVTFAMVARYRKAHSLGDGNGSSEKA